MRYLKTYNLFESNSKIINSQIVKFDSLKYFVGMIDQIESLILKVKIYDPSIKSYRKLSISDLKAPSKPTNKYNGDYLWIIFKDSPNRISSDDFDKGIINLPKLIDIRNSENGFGIYKLLKVIGKGEDIESEVVNFFDSYTNGIKDKKELYDWCLNLINQSIEEINIIKDHANTTPTREDPKHELIQLVNYLKTIKIDLKNLIRESEELFKGRK